jgi:hypothetical protein
MPVAELDALSAPYPNTEKIDKSSAVSTLLILPLYHQFLVRLPFLDSFATSIAQQNVYKLLCTLDLKVFSILFLVMYQRGAGGAKCCTTSKPVSDRHFWTCHRASTR